VGEIKMRTASLQTQNIILTNANVITMDPYHPRANWVAISSGTIRALGDERDHDKSPYENFEVLDCHGKTVLPGFNDAHCHLRAFVESLLTLDLKPSNGFRSLNDICAAIKNLSQKTSAGHWIRGTGYNEFYLAEKRHPTRWDLDEAAPDNPVKLTHRSGHAHVLNSLALRLVGISMESADPPGGLIDRDVNTGEPTGLLYEMGPLLSERVPPLDRQAVLTALELANKKLLTCGITSVQDASYLNDVERWRETYYWKEAGLFKPRINFMLGLTGLEQLEAYGFSGAVQENQLRLNGVKIILDETTGQLQPSQENLNNSVVKVHESGFQVAIHAVEESAVGSACSAIEYALNKSLRPDHRHRIEHCSVCSPPLASRLASLKIIVVTQPSFVFYNGDRYLGTVPDHQLQYLYPIRSLLKAGIPVAGSSDCPIVPPNPLMGIYSAVCRKSESGETLGTGEKIGPYDALRMYTVNAARASFEENLKGSITPGKLADLVVLNADPSAVTPDEIKDIGVEITIVDGKVVWRSNASQ
jgi:predicted amidohydrolase YtcJ